MITGTERYGKSDFATADEFSRYAKERIEAVGHKVLAIDIEDKGDGILQGYAFSLKSTKGTYGHPAYAISWTNAY